MKKIDSAQYYSFRICEPSTYIAYHQNGPIETCMQTCNIVPNTSVTTHPRNKRKTFSLNYRYKLNKNRIVATLTGKI